jgi:hypothetical protein
MAQKNDILCRPVKAALNYQSICDRSLSSNTVLEEHQSNHRLWKVFTLSNTWIQVYFDNETVIV